MERESDESVVDGRLVDLDEKMEGVDLSVDDERLEREVDRIDERSRTRHDVLILCCIVDYCCVFAPESTMADYGAWSGCNGCCCRELYLSACGQRNFFSGEQSAHGPTTVVNKSRVSIATIPMRYLASLYN